MRPLRWDMRGDGEDGEGSNSQRDFPLSEEQPFGICLGCVIGEPQVVRNPFVWLRSSETGEGVVHMKCFKHPDQDAVGICVTCGKGVCKDCWVEADDLMFCSHSCVPDGRVSVPRWFWSQAVTLLCGGATLAWGLVSYPSTGAYFLFAFAAIAFFAAIRALVESRRPPKYS